MTVIILTSGTSWTVPGDFTNTNQEETWGAGGAGGGGSGAQGGGGGGSGGYSSVSNLSGLSGSITISIGASRAGTAGNGSGGAATWFNGATQSVSSVSANGGGGGRITGAAGAGASTTGATGTTIRAGASGGTGNTPNDTGGGGGGAPGPDGVGTAGSNAGAAFGAGGGGDNGSGGAGGATVGAAGTANSNGGGGGAGSDSAGANGGAGALPGAGGGGSAISTAVSGASGGGQIRITYTPAATNAPGQVTDLTKGLINLSRYQDWQLAPLAASGPPTMSLGYVTDLPFRSRAILWYGHSMQGWQSSPLSGPFVNASPPEPVYDLAPRATSRHTYNGWTESPLSADSLPEIREQPYDTPYGRKWIKYDFSGWQQSPLVPELDLIGRKWYDNPQGNWKWLKHEYSGWQRGVIPDEYLVPLPEWKVPLARFNPIRYQDWQRGVPAADVQPPPVAPYTDLPVRVWDRRIQYQGVQLAPQPEIMSPPGPIYDVPKGRWNNGNYQYWTQGVIPVEYVVPPPWTDLPVRTWTTNRVDYSGWQQFEAIPTIFPPNPGSMFLDMPPTGKLQSLSRYMDLFQGQMVAPLPGNVAPTIPHTWLPLVGVGNQGP